MTEANNDSQLREMKQTEKRKRYVQRRKLLSSAGMLAGVGLAGCTNPLLDDGDDEDKNGNEEIEGPERPSTEYLADKYPGLEVLSPDPENAHADERETYINFITNREEHFIRNHYTPFDYEWEDHTIELRTNNNEHEITMDELRHGYPTETVTHTMQCGGNGRSFFDPDISGNQWHFGAVGTAQWTGTPVSEVLNEYDADTSSGKWLMVAGDEHPEGSDVFARSLPMEKVVEDCILAYQMNGEPMTIEHGFPVRLVVPGYFGNNNIKWVAEMEVMDRMLLPSEEDDRPWHTNQRGGPWEDDYLHWQQNSYRIKAPGQASDRVDEINEFDLLSQMDMEADGEIDYPPYVYEMPVKSLIGWPQPNDTVTPRTSDNNIEIVGVAWAGENFVDHVDISTDGGDTWHTAEMFGPELGPHAWRQFRYMWSPDSGGDHTLLSRATDDQGRQQPMELSEDNPDQLTIEDDKFPWHQDGYGNNAMWPHRVEITVDL